MCQLSVDFVICDTQGNTLLVIEHDGPPHRNNEDVHSRDDKKNRMFNVFGMEILRFEYDGTHEFSKQQIFERINPHLPPQYRTHANPIHVQIRPQVNHALQQQILEQEKLAQQKAKLAQISAKYRASQEQQRQAMLQYQRDKKTPPPLPQQGNIEMELIHGVPKKTSRGLSASERAILRQNRKKQINPFYFGIPAIAAFLYLLFLMLFRILLFGMKQ